ncbi:hypothetical protein F6476_14345 [Pseudomonas umsongensis]|nr:hypothetical protein F6476_14345 [Pseudomonas umsongensis]
MTRCKSETLSGRYRSNGYVHLKDNYRLPVRLRRHASGHLIPRGALRFFASMLAPTEGTRMASNQGRPVGRLAFDCDLAFDFLAPSRGRVEVLRSG